MADGLELILAAHLKDPFPDSIVRGADYGAVDAVLIDSDLYGWCRSVSESGSLGPTDARRFRQASDSLAVSLVTFPTTARAYYTRLLLAAELALRRIETKV